MELNIDFANTDSNWAEAKEWETWINQDKGGSHEEPNWSFDCSFKLDFDGPILSFSSRFYPPARHYGDGWDGSVTVYHKDEVLAVTEFQAETLNGLVEMVETHCRDYERKVVAAIKDYVS
ncbi:hypothetical protein V5T82_07220 [Magnetovibrio sp. PR-2]|uniref:hypothetical protein n=1 Tax=Magnetovibrio sp. PR-2 TaxID=3120356 RepID=UPI002FCE230D